MTTYHVIFQCKRVCTIQSRTVESAVKLARLHYPRAVLSEVVAITPEGFKKVELS